MNVDDAVVETFAAREGLLRLNPELLSWSNVRWNQWLRGRRNPETRGGQPAAAVAYLTCLDDLPLHVGLMQLLAMPGLDWSVVLVLPTSMSVRLAVAQARRDEWHELVRFVEASEFPQVAERLAPDAQLIVFETPDILRRQDLGRVAGLAADASSHVLNEPVQVGDGPFLGRAEQFKAWSIFRQSAGNQRKGLGKLASQDPSHIALESSEGVSTDTAQSTPDGLAPTVHSFDNGLDMPGLRDGGELAIITMRPAGGRQAIVRQRGDLLDPDQGLRVRAPASLLTVTPQRILAACREGGETRASREFLFHVPPSSLKAWMVSAFLNRGGGGNAVVRAFANGLSCRLSYAEDEPDELQDIPVVWGVLRQSDRILEQAKRQGLYFFYIDHAYFNRGHGKTYRITRNGYEAGPIRECPSDRIAELQVDVRPWRKSGREIIVCPPTDYFMQAHGCPDWLDETIASLRQATDRPIRIRSKPQPGQNVVPLPQALKKAHALVTHSSNVAIESACLGTPVFVDAASAAAPIGLTDLSMIEAPAYPDRDPWLAHLAYNQFSFDEIGDGRAWRMLLELEERSYV